MIRTIDGPLLLSIVENNRLSNVRYFDLLIQLHLISLSFLPIVAHQFSENYKGIWCFLFKLKVTGKVFGFNSPTLIKSIPAFQQYCFKLAMCWWERVPPPSRYYQAHSATLCHANLPINSQRSYSWFSRSWEETVSRHPAFLAVVTTLSITRKLLDGQSVPLTIFFKQNQNGFLLTSCLILILQESHTFLLLSSPFLLAVV